MFKKLFLGFIGSFLVILVVFSVYRASIGYGPLNVKTVFSLIAESFKYSGESISDLSLTFSDFVSSVESVVEEDFSALFGAEYGDVPFLEALRFLYSVVVGILTFLNDGWALVRALVKLLVGLTQDINNLIRLLALFLVNGSPYVVDPYFPVG